MMISIQDSNRQYIWREDQPGSGRKTPVLALLRVDEASPESLELILMFQQQQLDLEANPVVINGLTFKFKFIERYDIFLIIC